MNRRSHEPKTLGRTTVRFVTPAEIGDLLRERLGRAGRRPNESYRAGTGGGPSGRKVS